MAHSISEIIEIADKRTERRVGDQLDLKIEFWLALAEFCREKHFWWRRKTTTLNTVVGTATYDLASSAITTPQADDLDEIERVYRVDSATELPELDPILDQLEQAKALEATVSGEVADYMIEPGTTQTLRLGAPANAVKKLRVMHWAVPNPAVDTTIETVPLVPGSLHWCLVIALERSIFRFLYGENEPRWPVVRLRYEEAVAKAAQQRHWTTNREIAMRDSSRAVIAR